MQEDALISCLFLCVVFFWWRPPDPLPWLSDKTSGVTPHDLALLLLWQKTTLKGNSGNHKYLGTKELYGVCCKRIYSSLGGDASVSEGLRQLVFTALQLSPPTTAGQTWRTEPNKHFSSRNANTTSFPNRLQKSGVSSPSSWFKVQKWFTNKTRRWSAALYGPIWKRYHNICCSYSLYKAEIKGNCQHGCMRFCCYHRQEGNVFSAVCFCLSPGLHKTYWMHFQQTWWKDEL